MNPDQQPRSAILPTGVLISMLVASGWPLSALAQAPFQRGNANADISIDIADPVYALLWLFVGNVEPTCLDALDADDQDGVNVSDPVYLLRYLFTNGPVPPPPLDFCGRDPTPDDLDCGEHAACPDETPSFEVSTRPSSFGDGGENNQDPPAALLIPESVPRTPIEQRPLTAADRTAVETEALEFARRYLSEQGYTPVHDISIRHFARDEFGNFHMKMQQTFSGVPVIDGGVIVHLYRRFDDVADDVTDHLIPVLTVPTEPAISGELALSIAEGVYPRPGGPAGGPAGGPLPEGLEAVQRLAILPFFELRNNGSGGRVGTKTGHFDRVLADARLVWDITLAPVVPDFDELLLDEKTLSSIPSTEPDDGPIAKVRAANLTIGGREDENNADQDRALESIARLLELPGVRYHIDAQSGEILKKQVLIHQEGTQLADHYERAVGTGWSFASGKVELDTVYRKDTDRYYLMDARRPCTGPNIVWDALNLDTVDVGDMEIVSDKGNTWGNGKIEGSGDAAVDTRQTAAVDVAYGMGMTWDFFKNVLFRNGIDGEGGRIIAAVHWKENYENANYKSAADLLVFGDAPTPESPGKFYKLGTVAHEMAHDLWNEVGIDSKAGIQQALNEGNGDIMGGLTKLYRNTADGKGSRIMRFRNLTKWRGRVIEPASYDEDWEDEDGDIETQQGFAYWSEELEDKAEKFEHAAGLPYGRALIYLAEGVPEGYPDLQTTEFPGGLGGVGIAPAAQIWKAAVAYHLGDPTYPNVKTAFEEAAKSLYEDPMYVRAVKRAFYAIRVTEEDPENDELDPFAVDRNDPEIRFASLYAVDETSMTARMIASVSDDTGFRALRVDGHRNNGHYEGSHIFHGYVSLARAPAGKSTFTITIEDSAGKTSSVPRDVTKAHNKNVISNGDFEDGWTDWDNGEDYVKSDFERAFIGNGYLEMSGDSQVYQVVTIPPVAESATLVYWILARNDTAAGDWMTVEIRDGAGGGFLKQLANHNYNSMSREGRNALNKGFIRQEFDVSEYIGQTIRVQFNNKTDERKFLVDQVALTYTEEVIIGLPKVTLFEWENTVVFQLPNIQGLDPGQIHSVEYWVDGKLASYQTQSLNYHYAVKHLDRLEGNVHWVGAIVRGHQFEILGVTAGVVWFSPRPYNELLVNGGFEEGAWDLTYSDVPPRVEVVENNFQVTASYDGERCLRMGSQGTAHISQAGQVVEVPKQLKSLDFSLRVRRTGFDDDADGPDTLMLDLWDADTFERIETHHIVGTADLVGLGQGFSVAGYRHVEVSLTPGKYAGKNVLVLLKVDEDKGGATTFYVDNVSLRYANFGIGLGS